MTLKQSLIKVSRKTLSISKYNISNSFFLDTAPNKPRHKVIQQHICNVCGRKFAYLKNLNSHVAKIHSGAPMFLCNICNKNLATRKALADHIRKTHDVPTFTCDVCVGNAHIFKSEKAFNNHKLIHHSERKCDICKEVFNGKVDYVIHYKKYHNKNL